MLIVLGVMIGQNNHITTQPINRAVYQIYIHFYTGMGTGSWNWNWIMRRSSLLLLIDNEWLILNTLSDNRKLICVSMPSKFWLLYPCWQVLELIWMVYCPPATGLKKYKDSLWMSTQIEGKESMKLTREFAMSRNWPKLAFKQNYEHISGVALSVTGLTTFLQWKKALELLGH